MTAPITTAAEGTDGVHRLIDMVVEEVSLVDRAANKHRFLIVKRNDAMDDDTTTAEKATPEPQVSDLAIADGSPLGAAVAALESLTAIVELLGSLGADSTDTRLAALAQQLRATAEDILVRTGFATEEPATTDAVTEVTANAKASPPSTFVSDVAAAKQAFSRLTQLAASGLHKPTEKRVEVAVPSADAESLAKLAESFRSLSETVKDQQQRLGRVEKQFGLPNSAAPAEQVSKAADADVGWPLDLNQPKDRENVDKAVSFHDL
jgi:hypothetical protein